MTSNSKKNGYTYSSEELAAAGVALAQLSRAMLGYRQLSVDLVGINIKRPKVTGGEFLAVCKGLDAEGTPCVAFHSGFTLEDLVRGLDGRITNGTLKWRIDEYLA